MAALVMDWSTGRLKDSNWPVLLRPTLCQALSFRAELRWVSWTAAGVAPSASMRLASSVLSSQAGPKASRRWE